MAAPFADPYGDEPRGYDAPALEAFEIAPSDSANLKYATRAIYVSGAGDVKVVMRGLLDEGGQTVTFAAVPSGTILPISAGQVLATGTTATGLVGLV